MVNENSLIFLTFILMRMSGLILLNPVFGRQNVQDIVIGGFILVLSYLIFVSTPVPEFYVTGILEYVMLLLREFIIGYIMGFVMSLFFMVVTYAGEIIDMEIGIAMTKIFDPQSNSSVAVTGLLYNSIFMLLFFAVDGHLAFLKIILTSGEVVPYGGVMLNVNISMAVLDLFYECVTLAVKFAMPILAAELLAEVGTGVLMKAIPQINVFAINIQMKIFVGFFLLLLFCSPIGDFLQKLMHAMLNELQAVLTLL